MDKETWDFYEKNHKCAVDGLRNDNLKKAEKCLDNIISNPDLPESPALDLALWLTRLLLENEKGVADAD